LGREDYELNNKKKVPRPVSTHARERPRKNEKREGGKGGEPSKMIVRNTKEQNAEIEATKKGLKKKEKKRHLGGYCTTGAHQPNREWRGSQFSKNKWFHAGTSENPIAIRGKIPTTEGKKG